MLLARLMSGQLEPGTQINELALCEELGVSRTPLREALLRLEFEGFVEAQPGKGFNVTPLRPDTAFELHSLVGLLEGLAVRSIGSLPPEDIDELVVRLEVEHERMVAAAKARARPEQEELIELGDCWHATLIGAWQNAQFHEILALLKARLYRYTYLFVSEPTQLNHTLEQHQGIIDALRDHDIERAAQLMTEHWMSGAEARYEFLSASTQESSR